MRIVGYESPYGPVVVMFLCTFSDPFGALLAKGKETRESFTSD